MGSLDELDDVYISLEMSIKMWHAVKTHSVKKDQIDNDVPLVIRDRNNNLPIRANLLETENDFILWSQNSILLSFGSAAITLWEAVKMRNVFNESKLGNKQALNTEQEQLVGLSYMLRCCFAHGLTRPAWRINHQRYKIKLSKWCKVIDLSALDGKNFTYEHIGGYETLWFLRNYMRKENLI